MDYEAEKIRNSDEANILKRLVGSPKYDSVSHQDRERVDIQLKGKHDSLRKGPSTTRRRIQWQPNLHTEATTPVCDQ